MKKPVTVEEPPVRAVDDVDLAALRELDLSEPMAAVRQRIGASGDDLLLLAGWAGGPKGPRPVDSRNSSFLHGVSR